jgi:hypothetical protein
LRESGLGTKTTNLKPLPKRLVIVCDN